MKILISTNISESPEWLDDQVGGQFYGYVTGTANLSCEAEAEPAPSFRWLDAENNPVTTGTVINDEYKVHLLPQSKSKSKSKVRVKSQKSKVWGLGVTLFILTFQKGKSIIIYVFLVTFGEKMCCYNGSCSLSLGYSQWRLSLSDCIQNLSCIFKNYKINNQSSTEDDISKNTTHFHP